MCTNSDPCKPGKPSGYQFKLKRAAKEEKETDLLRKIPKISSFFSIDKSKTITEVSTDDDRDAILLPLSSTSSSVSISDGNQSGKGETDDDLDAILLPLPSTSSGVSISDGNQCGKGETVKSVENSEITSFDCTGGVVFSSDPSLWKVNDELRDHVAVHGVLQNCDADFSTSKRQYSHKVRYASESMFVRKILNGETQNRSWLVYFKVKGCVYCAPCMLFGKYADSESAFVNGFNDWKNASQRLKDHENSSGHKTSLGNLKVRGNTKARADSSLI
ncbi:uncharacterized protein LOC126890271 [Diabrotica virgifera virgifera]|uniref:TTF-type domain-containing protein n=1 Tax=Diabrotica virgifera virgifera TaxID=50390 RepID=A0ABM5KY24_DIAVI|nr:uncharacterized protein LOC126890271 [Diabrotica virgifera virgifera]